MAHELLKKWQDDPSFAALQAEEGQQKAGARLVTGLEGSQRSFLISAIFTRSEQPSLVLTGDTVRAEKMYEEIRGFLGDEDVFLFPGRDFFYAGEVLTQSRDICMQRIKVLERLAMRKRVLVVAPVTALLGKLIPAELWTQHYLTFQEGASFERDGLLAALVQMGYERADLTEGPGNFSVRGDIIDLYPFHEAVPFRISFFDEEVESIRTYDPGSQRSQEQVDEITIWPAREMILDQEALQKGVAALQAELEIVTRQLKQKNKEEAADRLRTRIENYLLKLESSGYFEGLEQYITYFFPHTSSLTEYFPPGSTLFWDEPDSSLKAEESVLSELKEYQATLLEQGDILPGQVEITWNLERVLAETSMKVLALSPFARRIPHLDVTSTVSIEARPVPSFMGQMDLFKEEFKSWEARDYEIFVLCDGESRMKELKNLLDEHGMPAALSENNPLLLELKESAYGSGGEGSGEVIAFPGEKTGKIITIARGRLENGFIMPSLNLVIISDREILPSAARKKRRKPATREKTPKTPLRDFQELKVGDLVVHEQHGIGRYMGIRTLEVDNVGRDYLFIKYAGEDKLYLPVDQIDLLQRYVGGEEKPPKVYSLGGQEWTRVKNRVKASVQELARELLSLYAAREAEDGYAFSSDHNWQQEFEARFPYEETPDQLRAIQEVKADMEKSRPMDRLLCGDVGYGKTEVALRAAFKALMDGKQVAFLVPTTILAQQHYNNFLERFEGFPIKVELLSRFRSQKEQKEILKGLKAGVIDVVVGTHRLFSKDSAFKDLGLLIIDEEHRFGVRHKEKLKMLRRDVDVLSMTATPIPRTLHMALSGARDLSVIDTPPENRYPVQTYVLEYSGNMIREAIQRELNRGGQVYFVYNRVQTIEKWAAQIQELVPEARIVVAHGQMPETKLEEVMHDFLQGEYDILVSTTIVEAGLDIPNVNTMIVFDADRFGLAQLYQLRGRVGRSNRLAYCYLTYRKDKVIAGDAVKRLQAVKEFTELGSGFKIAMRDLEIRGAGNVLGPEQHGHLVSVGYELYCRLLEQAIEKMKGQKAEPEQAEQMPKIDLHVNAYLPSSYISNQQQKIELYRRIATLESKEELKEMEDELQDRYGQPQPPVENLLKYMRLRQLARSKAVENIEQKRDQIVVRFQKGRSFEGDQLWQMVQRHRGTVSLRSGKDVSIKVRAFQEPKGEKKLLDFLIQILEEVS